MTNRTGSSLAFTLLLSLLAPSAFAQSEPTHIYLDFGFDWELQDGGPGEFGTDFCDGFPLEPVGANFTNFTFQMPCALLPVKHYVEERGADFDGSGAVDDRDTRAIADTVLARIRRIYEPFNVQVHLAHARTPDDVLNTLEAEDSRDTYVLIGGDFVVSGVASQNPGDNVAIISIGGFVNMNNDFEQAVSIAKLVQSTAHEIGHTFGLEHTGGASLAAYQTWSGDFMSYHDRRDGTVVLRFDVPLVNAGTRTQNAYEVLRERLGLRPNAPAYVTGTGAHDFIRITPVAPFTVEVFVKAYADRAHTRGLASATYEVSTRNGLLVDASSGDDVVVIEGLAAPLRTAVVRGNQDDDTLIGSNGAESFEGGWGNDVLEGGGGDDRYVFEGYFPEIFFDGTPNPDLTLGEDTVRDESGTDTLDFLRYGRGIFVDLADTGVQSIGRTPLPTSPLLDIPIELEMFRGGRPSQPVLHLTLENPGGSAQSTGIENVIGSPYDDEIWGNELRNWLYGHKGSDGLVGDRGEDALNGSSGFDICVDDTASTEVLDCDDFEDADREAWMDYLTKLMSKM